MGSQAYETARRALITQSGFWTALVGGLAFAALAAAALSLFRARSVAPEGGGAALGAWRDRLAAALAVALWGGWARLAYFHYLIWRAVRIPNMAAAEAAGRGGPTTLGGLAVPLWIEGEKLYAWACLLAIAVILLWRRRHDPVFSWGLIVLAVLTIGALWATNPFTAPLPGLHTELTGYFAATARGGAVAFGALQEMWARKTFFYNSAYMWTHPPALFVSYAAFVISFIASILLLATRGVRYDRISYDYAKFGYLILTGGMLLGYPWAIQAWKGEPWWWSGKINMSLMMWVMYSGYLHSRLYLKQRAMWRLAGWLGVVCFATLVMTYLSTYLVPGAHSVAQP